jgi:hypothetical protein
MASSTSRYFQKLLDILERLGSQVCLYAKYEDLFGTDEKFVSALSITHLDILNVLSKARMVFERRGKLSKLVS